MTKTTNVAICDALATARRTAEEQLQLLTRARRALQGDVSKRFSDAEAAELDAVTRAMTYLAEAVGDLHNASLMIDGEERAMTLYPSELMP